MDQKWLKELPVKRWFCYSFDIYYWKPPHGITLYSGTSKITMKKIKFSGLKLNHQLQCQYPLWAPAWVLVDSLLTNLSANAVWKNSRCPKHFGPCQSCEFWAPGFNLAWPWPSGERTKRYQRVLSFSLKYVQKVKYDKNCFGSPQMLTLKQFRDWHCGIVGKATTSNVGIPIWVPVRFLAASFLI